MPRIVLTGATGFVGRAVAARGPHVALRLSVSDWRERIAAVDFDGACVIHLAARVHRMDDRDEGAFELDNVAKTEALALAAARGRASCFVFASTGKVNGEETVGRPFLATDTPHPEDAYARSKGAAEQALARVAQEHGLPVHIVRPPLVYGPCAKGNLAALLRLCDSPWPLPFASLRNRRSWIAVGDLADFLVLCAQHPAPGVHTWLVSHPTPASTADIASALRCALGRPARLWHCPPSFLESAATWAGRRQAALRLTRSLEVDGRAAMEAFAWKPRVSLVEAARVMASAWRAGGASA